MAGTRWPPAGTVIDDVEVTKTMFGGVRKTAVRRPIRRSGPDAAARRAALRIGIPRVLNIYSSTRRCGGHRFEALGLRRARTSMFSDATSEEMWAEGSRYGSESIPAIAVEGLAGAHPPSDLQEAPQAEARLHLLSVHHAHADVRSRNAGLDELPDRRRRAKGHAGGVHEGKSTSSQQAGIGFVDDAVTLQEPHYCSHDRPRPGARGSV